MHVDGTGKYIFRLFMGIRREGGSRAERLNPLILEDTEVSGPFQTLTGENMLSDIKVTLKIQGICLIVCNFAAGHGSKEEQGFLTSEQNGFD